MTTDLIRTQLETGLTLGSLKSLVKATRDNVMLLLDTSDSMNSTMANGRTRVAALREVVRQVLDGGRVPMIAFGGPFDAQVRFVDNVPDANGSTPLHLAIPFAKAYGATRLVVISDGCPDLTEQSMIEAKAFGGQIDVVFVGDAGEFGSTFLDELARVTGGKRLEGNLTDPKQLTSTVVGLLEGEVEKKPVIQGEGWASVDEADAVEPADESDDDDTDEDDDDEDEDDDDEE